MFNTYAVVRLLEDIGDKLRANTRGVILTVYPSDPTEYEVEFVDDEGATIEMRAVKESQIRLESQDSQS